MKKLIAKITAFALTAAMVIPAGTVEAKAASLSNLLPAAGISRVLHEGKSMSSMKADPMVGTKGAGGVSGLATAGVMAVDPAFTKNDNTNIATMQETSANADPALMTVGAASAQANSSVSSDDVATDSLGFTHEQEEAVATVAGVTVEEFFGEYALSDDELADVTTRSFNQGEEDFTNLVIAQVNDYVNVRQEPSEDSEVVGKLYNKSVGDLLEDAGGWYKIKSGNCTGYVKAEYCVTGDYAQELAKEVGTRMAEVTTTTLFVRKEPSTDAAVLGMVPMGDALTVSEEIEGWAKVSVEEGDGYVSTEFVHLYTDFVHAESKKEEEARLAKEAAARKAAQEAARKAAAKKGGGKVSGGGGKTYAAAGSGTGSNVASFALQFVGNPYVYGGTSLTNGADCSGFVMSVYRNFGVSLPHSSGGDRSVGYDVGGLGNAQPGDIVCYSGHVGIYIGGGQIVHASTARTGIKVSNASYRNVLAVRRIF